MGLQKTFFLLCTSILLTGLYSVSAQESEERQYTRDPFEAVDGVSVPEDAAAADELIELKERLRQIESMLLAQKDRENELLHDLNKFALTVQDQPDETLAAAYLEIQAAEQRARSDSAALEAKIQSLEQEIATGHERDIQMGQDMNKTIVVTVSIVAGIGMLVFLVTVYLQYRLISRPMQPYYMPPQPLAIETNPRHLPLEKVKTEVAGRSDLVENSKVEETNERFVSAIERLEERIIHMETGLSRADTVLHADSAATVEEAAESEAEIGEGDQAKPSQFDAALEEFTSSEDLPLTASRPDSDPRDLSDEAETDDMDVAVLEEEGKRFLQREDWETAFRYYEQLVRLDSKRVDNWVNRGRALEMLRREEEAINSYDNAIKANPDLPSPFLYKAALLSRMERYEEAQKFYNEALSKVPIQKNEKSTAGVI